MKPETMRMTTTPARNSPMSEYAEAWADKPARVRYFLEVGSML